MPTRPYNQKSLCHPEKTHKAFGLCEPCWQKKRYKENGGDKARAYARLNGKKYKYGITLEQYAAMQAEYEVCGICGGSWGKRGPVIDHNHKTKKVRALLCDSCNIGLGLFKEDPRILKEALRYIEFWSL